MEWFCNSCSVKNCNRDFLCKTCQCARPTATRKIKPPAHVQRGKFIDKVVMDLVQKATKRKPASQLASKTRVKEAIRKKVSQRSISISQKRRGSLIEKQFKAKADQIAKLTQELESMKALVFETSQSGYIRDQLQAIRNIGEVMANPSSSSSYEEYNDNSNDNDYSPHESNGVNGSSRVSAGGTRKYSRKELFPNKCKHCNFTCISIWRLSSHLSSKHGIKNSFKCIENDCDFSTSSKYFLDKHVSSDHGHSLVDSLESTKPVKSPKTKASKTALKRKNLMNNKGKKKIYRPTMINDGDTIDRDVEIVESLLTDTDEEQINGTDEKDTDWVPDNLSEPEETEETEEPVPDSEKVISSNPEELLSCPHPGCHYTTSEKYYLTRHRKRKHGEKMARKKREAKKTGDPKPKKPSVPRKRRIKEKKFSCELCGAKATSMWYINRHMRLHTGEKPFVCEYPGCTYKSYRKFHITRHVINIHSTERPHKCELCDYSAKTRENLRQHNLSRHAPGHFEPCEFCDFRAKLKEGLRSHVRKCHKFVCKDCSWEFSTDTDLTKHLQLHREDGLHCEVCLQVMKDVEEYKVHSFTIHGVQIQTRIARRSRSSLSTCEICNYQFANSPSLEAHKSYHTSDGAIICQFCGLVCKSMEKLKDHTVTLHGFVIDAKLKPVRTYRQKFTCSTCNYELSSRTALETHFQQHRLDGSVKCTKCPHISMKMSDLVQHCLIIHGERLDASPSKKKNVFPCDICKYNFPTASKLENHKNKHKEDGSILCGMCKVTMPSMGEMKGHMMLMHGVEMDANQLEESTPSAAPSVCEICSYDFKDQDQLSLHRSCHMADGSICCTMCPYYSPNIEYLAMHMREIHQVEIHRDKGSEVQQVQKQIEASHASRRELFKAPQLLQLQSSNALLHGSRTDTLNSVAQSLSSDVESYIRPPACVFDSHLSAPTSNSMNSFSSNVISGFSKSDFVDFLQPTIPPQATISITNNATKFVINNFHNHSTLVCGGNRKTSDHLKLDERNLAVAAGSKLPDPLSQALSESGIVSRGGKLPATKAVVAVKSTRKSRANPGLFM